MTSHLVLGLNQYTHSAAACLLDHTGEVVVALAKERLTRKKHDGGDVAELVGAVMETAGINQEDLGMVVANNHLFRIDSFHSTLEWQTAQLQHRPTFTDSRNLLSNVPRSELSHHLAHAWSVLPWAPFEKGLIVVMDGMGSTWEDLHSPGENYFSDIEIPASQSFEEYPADRTDYPGWREAESVYAFNGTQLEKVWKRWIPEKTPVFLHNYGFENMDSLGAVYSRISSHIFGDWNACGKVMGLAPWDDVWNGAENRSEKVMSGPLEALNVDWERLKSLPHGNKWADKNNHGFYAKLANEVQSDLEDIVLDFLIRLREKTGERNICLCGGVALNSTLNGRIVREAGFDNVFIPPWPGDDGIAMGCAWFGLEKLNSCPPPKASPGPLLGRSFDEPVIAEALKEVEPWIETEAIKEPANAAGTALADGEMVGWFQGRSEFGPRALGARCILADPRDPKAAERLNSAIKKREAFRPFAPAVLEEEAEKWFPGATTSPYMSITVTVAEDCKSSIPAVVAADGTARIQTLGVNESPALHAVATSFYEAAGIPMILNTSFNTRGEPIVETPHDALATFLDSGLDVLFLGQQKVKRKAFPASQQAELSTPRATEGTTVESTSDPTGEILAVRFSARGKVFDGNALEQAILEASDGDIAMSEIQAHFQNEFEVPKEDFLEAIKRLWTLRLISLD